MEKKYLVFISADCSDLKEERKTMLDVLLMADCIPAVMETPAGGDLNFERFNAAKKVIDLCDYYALLIGKRYGPVYESTGLSSMELEYDYAVSKGIPVLVFAVDDSMRPHPSQVDTETAKIMKLAAFRAKALSNKLASVWKDAADLSGKAAFSIMKAKNEILRPGWTRGSEYDEGELLKQIIQLQNNNEHLQASLHHAFETIAELKSDFLLL